MSKVHRSFKLRVRSIVLAVSCLIVILGIATVYDSEPAKTALIKTVMDFEINRQVAEAEEMPVTPILIGSWIESASTSTTEAVAESEKDPAPKTTPIAQFNSLKTTVSQPTPIPKPTVQKSTVAKPTPSPTATTAFNLASVGQFIHAKTNSARSAKDLPSLAYDSTLASIAKGRSDDMATRGYFSHVSQSGCDLSCRVSGLSYISYGENLGEYTEYTAFTEPALAARFIEMWLNSPGHRKNLLSSVYTHQGIGVAAKGDRIVVTVLFGSK